jgi:SAM-dependent methyltransferase
MASARRTESRELHNLDYLFSGIRRELEGRLQEKLSVAAGSVDASSNTSSFADFDQCLVIDFLSGDIKPTAYENVNFISLLENNGGTVAGLEALEDESFDCVVENLQVCWLDVPEHLRQINRILKTDGTYVFSCFGPDTLYEVWRAWHEIDDFPHVHDFVDMHHLGDALLKTGFKKPIVDAEWTFIDYPDTTTLCRDLKAEGFMNIRSDRRKTLTGKQRFRRFHDNMQSGSNILNPSSPFRVTYEIVYGMGVKSVSSRPGSIKVDFSV